MADFILYLVPTQTTGMDFLFSFHKIQNGNNACKSTAVEKTVLALNKLNQRNKYLHFSFTVNYRY